MLSIALVSQIPLKWKLAYNVFDAGPNMDYAYWKATVLFWELWRFPSQMASKSRKEKVFFFFQIYFSFLDLLKEKNNYPFH